MKKSISFLMGLVLLFALSGCQKQLSPEELEKKISEQLNNAKTIDSKLVGDISMNVSGAGVQKITIDSSFKGDMSGEFPKFIMDGKFGLEGVMTFPISLYMDETQMVISLLGQTQTTPLPEETKTEIKNMTNSGVQLNLNKTVKESTYNEQKALEITYDATALNQLMASSNEQGTIDSLICYYVLNDKDELDTLVAKMSITSEGEKADVNLSIKINSLDKPITIDAPQAELETQTPTTLDILTQSDAA